MDSEEQEMSKYQDGFSMWHDKECINGRPSSNNAWIYTAYAKYLAPGTVLKTNTEQLFNGCMVMRSPLIVNRRPGKLTPPMSKDEVLGMVSLGLLDYNALERSHFNFCNVDYGPRKLSLTSFLKAIRSLYGARNNHRNYLWENKVYDAFPLMFKLMPWDVYYVKKMFGKRVNPLEFVMFYLNALFVFTKGNKSVRMLLLLQLKDMKHSLLNRVPEKQWVQDYFEEGHDFRKGL